MTQYYTYQQDAYDHMGPNQEVKFAAGSGYYLVDNPPAKASTPAPVTSGGAGNDYSDVSSSAAGGPTGSTPFTNPVGADGQQSATPAPDSPQAGDDNAGNGATNPTTPSDWAEIFWGSLGLPSDLVAQLDATLAQYPDATTAQAIGMNMIMQSGWFAQTFPGYQMGEANGLYSDMTGYRNYVNALNTLSNQYNGSNVSTGDVLSLLQQGLSPDTYGKRLAGAAYVNANSPDIQRTLGAFGNQAGQGPGGQLTQDQLTAYGQEEAGIDTPLGQQLNTAYAAAKTRMDKVFQGVLGRPAGLTLGQQGLNAPGLLGQKQASSTSGNSDVAAQ